METKTNKDVYGVEIDNKTNFRTYTKEEIKINEKREKEHKALVVRKLKSEPKVEDVLKLRTAISKVETRLFTNLVEVTKPRYEKQTDEVVKKVRLNNVQNYFKQINHNLGIGAKALFLVCRDLNTARHDLGSDDFKILSESLPLSDSTISKYTKIAQSDVCKQLFIKGELPENWTTMYEIAKVSEIKLKEKLIKNVNTTSTLDHIFNLIGKVFKKVPPKFDFDLTQPKEFIKIAFESGKEFVGDSTTIGQGDPIALLMVKEKVEIAVKEAMKEYQDKYPSEYGLNNPAEVEVSFHNEIVEQTKKSMNSFFTKEKKPGNKNKFHFEFGKFTNTISNALFS